MDNNYVRGLIFDFDGLIIDTELPSYQAWQEIYRDYGFDLPVQTWGEIVGGAGASDFDPLAHLENLVGSSLDGETLRARQRERELALAVQQDLLPGVLEYLDTAQRLDLRLAIASSSKRDWVAGHLRRLRLLDRFAVIRTAENVERTKPDPALFLSALEGLGLAAEEAIALEDSPNGILAAKRAGLFCVAVPNSITRQLTIPKADVVLDSLEELPLERLLHRVATARHNCSNRL